MTSFSSTCVEFFHTSDLYEVLGIPKTAKKNEVKKAYYKMSLKVHPDRSDPSERGKATQKFQALSKVYSILSDSEKRSVYDETGTIDEENDDQERDWLAYWRLLFRKITINDIEEFKKKYRGSDEELTDLKSAYERFQGDMDKIMEYVPCAEVDDEPRLREILTKCIEQKEIQDCPKFTKESASKRDKRNKRFKKEAAEADKVAKEMGLDTSSLEAMIMKRQEHRMNEMDSFFDKLEAKYGGGNKSKRLKAEKSEEVPSGSSPSKGKQKNSSRKSSQAKRNAAK